MALHFQKSLCTAEYSEDVLCDYTGKIRPLHHGLRNQGATLSWQLYSWKMTGCWQKPLGRLALVSQRIALSFMRERVYLLALTPSFVKKSQ